MTHDELSRLEYKVKEANKLNAAIDNIDNLIDSLSDFGKCESITFGSWQIYDSDDGFGMREEGESYWGITEITPEILNISKEEFNDLYRQAIFQKLLELKQKKMDEYEKL